MKTCMALSIPEKEDKQMQHKVSKQILSALLAFVMIIGLIPTSSVTVFPHIKKDAALTGGIF